MRQITDKVRTCKNLRKYELTIVNSRASLCKSKHQTQKAKTMYTTKNFKSKKEFKQAVEAWNDYIARAAQLVPADTAAGHADFVDRLLGAAPRPRPVTYFQPGPFGGNEPRDGTIYIEGPHYPEAHRFYAQCIAKDGVIVKVK